MAGQGVDDLLQPLQLDGLGGRVIDLEHPRLFDPWDAVRPRIEPCAQDDDLVEPFAQAGFEEIIDVLPSTTTDFSLINIFLKKVEIKENQTVDVSEDFGLSCDVREHV